MNNKEAQELLKLDDKFKTFDISKIKKEDTDYLYEKLFHKIKNFDSFKDNLNKIIKIIKKKIEERTKKEEKFTNSRYYFLAFCYFLSLKKLYYNLLRLDRTNGYIKEINISIIGILARLLDEFNYLYELSYDKIFTKEGFIPLNDDTLKLYNNTISSYNDFMTVYYNIISFKNDNCEKTCKISSKIFETIDKLEIQSTQLNTMVVNFMNQHGQSFKKNFVQVIQKPKLKNNSNNNNRKNRINQNNSSSAANEQTSLLPENEQNSQKKSSCSIL